MAISEHQENAMAQARAARSKQDAKQPFVINRNDGRLMPNTPLLRKHKDYMPYTGSVKASLDERMNFIRTGSSRSRVIDSTPEEVLPPFDVGAATKEELVAFAAAEFGVALSVDQDIRTLRKKIVSLAEGAPLS